MFTTAQANRRVKVQSVGLWVEGYNVTRADFADLAELATGQHCTRVNREHFESKLLSISHLSTPGYYVKMGQGRAAKAVPLSFWYGGLTSMAEAVQLMTEGWAEGAARAAEVAPKLREIVPPPKTIRRRVKWDEVGSELHIDRALAGDWDKAWRNTGPHVTNTPRVITLACNFGGDKNKTPEQLFWNAAQMLVACDLLESAGYSVELRAIKANLLGRYRKSQPLETQRFHMQLTDVTVKRAGQPLRADTVAAVFGHAGVYRTFGHMAICSAPWNAGTELGKPWDIGATLADAVAAGLTDAPDFVLEHSFTRDDAAAQVERVLAGVAHTIAAA